MWRGANGYGHNIADDSCCCFVFDNLSNDFGDYYHDRDRPDDRDRHDRHDNGTGPDDRPSNGRMAHVARPGSERRLALSVVPATTQPNGGGLFDEQGSFQVATFRSAFCMTQNGVGGSPSPPSGSYPTPSPGIAAQTDAFTDPLMWPNVPPAGTYYVFPPGASGGQWIFQGATNGNGQ